MSAGIAAVLFGGLLWLGWLAWTAPEGWEDSEGFHYGQPPADQDLPDLGD